MMKKLILLLISLTTLTNVSFASFPVVASLKNKLSENIPIGEVLGPLFGLTLLVTAFYILKRFFRKGNTVRRWMWENFWLLLGSIELLLILIFGIVIAIYGGGVSGG
jgi:hypothetical protein